jgi:hypothetical protein
MFRKCQRQWFFKNQVANAIAKDVYRKEAYYLSKLQSLAAWRGSIVDTILSDTIIPAFNRRQTPHLRSSLQQARALFDNQLVFAQQRRIREPNMTQQRGGTAYAALHAIEYDKPITDDDLSQAWNDIEQALTCFFEMDELAQIFRTSSQLIAQRALSFSYNGTPVRMVPDVIVFYPNQPPTIIDWKVHTFGMQNYRLQLASYAIALTQCKPHVDFPRTLSKYSAHQVGLLEVQLLMKVQRQYVLTETDVESVYSYIARTAREMALALNGETQKTLSPFDFPVALDPDECQRCAFRSLCWE